MHSGQHRDVEVGEITLNAETNTSYAVVILTDSTNYRVLVATLGQFGQNGVITKPTYATGVLLESSNAETWTPLNGSDLAMKIYGYDFDASGAVRSQPITGVQYSDLNLDEYSAIPQGTGMIWEYSTDGSATWDAIVPAEEEQLPNIATTLMVGIALRTGLTDPVSEGAPTAEGIPISGTDSRVLSATVVRR